jgi:peptidoglycan DL-endopeptidase CwlO
VLSKSMLAALAAAGIAFVVALAVVGGAGIGSGSASSGGGIPVMCSAVCGEVAGEVPAGPAASFGLPVSYAIPADADPAEVVAVGYALAQLGKAHRWAAAGPDEFDCSGLTMQAWAQAGVPLAHFTVDQLAEGAPVTNLALMSPGDLILTPGSDGTLAAPGHVGLYIGDGLVESAVDPAEGVIVQTWSAFISGGLSGVRHIG